MSRFDRNKVSCDLSNNAYSKQIKVVNKNFKSNGVISVNGQDGEVILNYIDQLEKGIPEGVAPLNSEGIIDEQYLPPISSDNFKTINGESILGSGDIEVGSNLTFENGLREDNGVVKLGLDLNTYGKTDDGILTEDLYLIRKPIPEVPDYFVGLNIGDSSLALSMESESYDILNIIRLSSQDIELRHSSGVRLYSNNEISLSAGSSGGLSTFAVNNSEIYYTNNVSNSANVRFAIGDGSDTYQRHIEIVATNPNWTSVTGIIMAESDKKLKIIDSWGNFGLSYSGNYSTNGKLDDRWIPDWGAVKDYVDENAGGTLQSITTGAGNNVTNNAIQVTGANNVDFTQKGLVLASVPDSNMSQVAYADGGGTIPSLITLTNESASIGFQGDGTSPSVLDFYEGRAIFSHSGAIGQGILYQSDYSANFTNRSLVDKAYVDSKSAEPVSDAVDEADVVVKFNQLLENMRLSGLLKT